MAKTAETERHIFWQPWREPGLEHLRLVRDDLGVRADGQVIGVRDGAPFRLHYQIHCDLEWQLREATLEILDPPYPAVALRLSEGSHWTDAGGRPIHTLDGCTVIDISATPFTNTLPIRRLARKPGAAAGFRVAYVTIPELRLEVDNQRYMCLAVAAGRAMYRYEDLGLFAGFTADLLVDADGLVLDYPELYRRIWSH
jgi:hypothetical protein